MNNIQIKANKLAADIISKALREGSILSDNKSENPLIEKELMKIEENLRNNKLYEDVEQLKANQDRLNRWIIRKEIEERIKNSTKYANYLKNPYFKEYLESIYE